MNYQKHYDALINRAKNRLLEGYCETHHIIPRCMGGNNDADNLVDLTAEEHYVAHQLLVKMHPNNHKLVAAAIYMTTGSSSNKKYRMNNKLYKWIKELHQLKWKDPEYYAYWSNMQSDLAKIRWSSPEFKNKMRKINKESSNRPKVKKQKSDRLKVQWQDPEYREKTLAMLKEQAKKNSQNENWKTKRKVLAKQQWDNASQETKENRKNLGKKIFDEFRKNMTVEEKERQKEIFSKNMKKRWQDPDYRKKMVESAKRQWQEPEFREMHRTLNRHKKGLIHG